MREALVAAAKASSEQLGTADFILQADRKIKRKVYGGWFVLNKRGRSNHGRSRR